MPAMLGTVQLVLLAALLYCGLACAVFSILDPRLVRWTATWAPASRHRGLVVSALAPWALGLAALLSVMLPSLLGMVWPSRDHCLVHGGHSHLCFVHASHHPGGWTAWAVIACAALGLAVVAVRSVRSLRNASQVTRALVRSARFDATLGAWRVPYEEALCLSVGLARPKVILSEGLLARATPQEVEVMLAHERAHARRNDSLVRLVAHAATAFLMPVTRRTLLHALEQAAEQACDEHAVLRVGDRLSVAETLLSMERKLGAAAMLRGNAATASFGGNSVPARVEAMLQPARQASACTALVIALFCAIAVVLGAHDALHHATESLLSTLSH